MAETNKKAKYRVLITCVSTQRTKHKSIYANGNKKLTFDKVVIAIEDAIKKL